MIYYRATGCADAEVGVNVAKDVDDVWRDESLLEHLVGVVNN